MSEATHVLISLEQKHAENILIGKKQVELRRRTMGIPVGSVVWIYVKKPIGAVVGYARVSNCHSFAPSTLWNKFSVVSGLTRKEFFDYFQGVTKGFALALDDVHRLRSPVSLESLRNGRDGFHPPQFYMRLPPKNRVLNMLQNARK